VEIDAVGTVYVSCPANWTLLSCGTENTQTSAFDLMRYALPVSFTTCECNEAFGMRCSAWCTNAPLPDLNQEKANVPDSAYARAECSIPKKVLGCGHKSLAVGGARLSSSSFYPFEMGCACNDYQGSVCSAFCASNVNSFDIRYAEGNATVVTSCGKPSNAVFGCGIRVLYSAKGSTGSYAHVLNGTACQCYESVYYRCYAICGTLRTY